MRVTLPAVAIYLGFDSSTQSLTATAIEAAPASRRVLFTRSFQFDELLPHYGTRHGVLPSPAPGVVQAPPIMWAEALDLVIGILRREEGIDWTDLQAVSGSAQQHGTVYLNEAAMATLCALQADRPLVHQVQHVLARSAAPIWMDTSTTTECREIEDSLGGWEAVARLTGSRCYERFPAAQIRKFAKEEPAAYERTARIHLVSSWLASLLAGRDAPIDHGDGSGMNLMTLSSKEWSDAALDAAAPGLRRKLPELAAPWTVVGPLAPYWRKRHALPPAQVVVWSGDNPNSLIGTGLVTANALALSLGTSDTVFRPMERAEPGPDGTGHVFASPAGNFMGMTVFKNGSLARERIRDAYGLKWTEFSAALRSTQPGNSGGLMLPWFEPEITPAVHTPGVRRLGVDPKDAAANIRALIEAQAMSMALHTRWMGRRPETIRGTGGASANRDILQVFADVFGATVLQLPDTNSAALGAALRACHAHETSIGHSPHWSDIVRGFTDPVPNLRVEPVPAHSELYAEHTVRYEQFENSNLAR